MPTFRINLIVLLSNLRFCDFVVVVVVIFSGWIKAYFMVNILFKDLIR